MIELILSGITIKSVIIFVSIFIILLLIAKKLFSLTSTLKLMGIILVLMLIITAIYFFIIYLKDNKYILENKTSYYVYGNITQIDEKTNTINMKSIRSSLDEGGMGDVVIVINSKTRIRALSSGGVIKNITISDLHIKDNIEVMCKENKTNGKENKLTAIELLKKNY